MKSKALTVKLIFLIIAISVTTAQAQTKTTTRSGTTRYQTSSGNTWMNVEADSANDPNKRITMYKNGEVYKIKVVNEKITEMQIDDKKIPEEDFPKYGSMVKEILVQLKKDEEQAEKDRAQAKLDREQAGRDREQAGRDRLQADKDREQAIHDREQADRDRQQAVKDRAQADKDKAQSELDRQQADRDRQQAVKDRQQAVRDREQAVKDRAQAEVDRKQAEEDRKLLAALIDDLISEKLITSRDDLYIVQLTDESLIVNDKKQPADLHQKFKAKYLKKAGTRFTFTNRPGRSGLSIEHNN